MEAGRTKILVADRNRLVAEALGALFQELVALADVRLANSLDETVALAHRDRPELIVLDAWIGGLDSSASVRKILAASPSSSVFVVATKVNSSLVTTLKEAGAAGFYEKESLPASAHAIAAILAGVR